MCALDAIHPAPSRRARLVLVLLIQHPRWCSQVVTVVFLCQGQFLSLSSTKSLRQDTVSEPSHLPPPLRLRMIVTNLMIIVIIIIVIIIIVMTEFSNRWPSNGSNHLE